MVRCIDDHPNAICLCESEINRALFRDYFVRLHCERMVSHGLALEEAVGYLDRKHQDDVASWLDWYSEIAPRLAELYAKESVAVLGDKSPDLFRSRRLIEYVASSCRLIYTVRDPRAIVGSIARQDETSQEDKAERWDALIQNYVAWKPYLNQPNILVVRFEDLLSNPKGTIEKVYSHLALPPSDRFLEAFPRPFPRRFLWETAVEFDTGISKEFDATRITSWQNRVTPDQLRAVHSNATIVEFMQRFGYEL
jgi:Sulfotransferase family